MSNEVENNQGGEKTEIKLTPFLENVQDYGTKIKDEFFGFLPDDGGKKTDENDPMRAIIIMGLEQDPDQPDKSIQHGQIFGSRGNIINIFRALFQNENIRSAAERALMEYEVESNPIAAIAQMLRSSNRSVN